MSLRVSSVAHDGARHEVPGEDSGVELGSSEKMEPFLQPPIFDFLKQILEKNELQLQNSIHLPKYSWPRFLPLNTPLLQKGGTKHSGQVSRSIAWRLP